VAGAGAQAATEEAAAPFLSFVAVCRGRPMGRIDELRGGPEHMRVFWSIFGMFGKPTHLRTDDHPL
jgi:hypothetical protein